MFKVTSAIIKEFRVLVRDKVGLAVMFIMPIILVIIMTSIQNSTYELINDNKIPIIIINKDTSKVSLQFEQALKNTGMFTMYSESPKELKNIRTLMHSYDALVTLVIPSTYFTLMQSNASKNASKALQSFGINSQTIQPSIKKEQKLQIYFNPVLQESYKYSIEGAIQSALQIQENKLMIESLYVSVNQKEMPDGYEKEMMPKPARFEELPIEQGENTKTPNASEHNVPAWTLFAMFFTVVSLGGNIVKEKLSGSFIRLKLLPTNYIVGLFAKQIVYLCVVILQVAVIFSIGKLIFPLLNLPILHMPTQIFSLFLVTIICGWSAISFALCIGVFSSSEEQASGFGSVSVVILAAFGGVFVPSFAMPEYFDSIMKFSPFYWGLESYYGLFLEEQSIHTLYSSLIPLIVLSIILQIVAFIKLKTKKLI